MAQGILSTAELLKATGYKRPADLASCLQRQGVRFFEGRDGPWTTIGLIEAAGGLRPAGNDAGEMYGATIL